MGYTTAPASRAWDSAQGHRRPKIRYLSAYEVQPTDREDAALIAAARRGVDGPTPSGLGSHFARYFSVGCTYGYSRLSRWGNRASSAVITTFLSQPDSSHRYILAQVLATLFFCLGIIEDVPNLLGGVGELQLDFLHHPQQHLRWL